MWCHECVRENYFCPLPHPMDRGCTSLATPFPSGAFSKPAFQLLQSYFTLPSYCGGYTSESERKSAISEYCITARKLHTSPSDSLDLYRDSRAFPRQCAIMPAPYDQFLAPRYCR